MTKLQLILKESDIKISEIATMLDICPFVAYDLTTHSNLSKSTSEKVCQAILELSGAVYLWRELRSDDNV